VLWSGNRRVDKVLPGVSSEKRRALILQACRKRENGECEKGDDEVQVCGEEQEAQRIFSPFFSGKLPAAMQWAPPSARPTFAAVATLALALVLLTR